MTPRQIAMRKGQPKYLGQPCAHCGGQARYTSNTKCVYCEGAKPPRLSRVAKCRRQGPAYQAALRAIQE